MFVARWDVFKVTKWSVDHEVMATSLIKQDVWLVVKPRTHLELNAIAKQHGGDMLCPTSDTKIITNG